jgi:hypothetical protein
MDLPGLNLLIWRFLNGSHISESLTLGLIFKEAVDLGGRTVVSADSETVISNVEDQVLAHNGQTDETEISTR